MAYGDSYSAVQSAELAERGQRQAALENSLRNLYSNLAQMGQAFRSVASMAQQQKQFDANLDYSNRALNEQIASRVSRDREVFKNRLTDIAKGSSGTAYQRDLPYRIIESELEVGDPENILETYQSKMDPDTFAVMQRHKNARRAEIDRQHRELEIAAEVLNQEQALAKKLKANSEISANTKRTWWQKMTPNWLVPEAGVDVATNLETENELIKRQLARVVPVAEAIKSNKDIMSMLTRDSRSLKFTPAMQAPSWLQQQKKTTPTTSGTANTGRTVTTNLNERRAAYANQLRKAYPDAPREELIREAIRAIPR